ncbi:hypothetical protein APHAL10511_002529 [Amanita phalloides]|nr:hypothetical protein APHAL10511_002529 [Amanita phalloides]
MNANATSSRARRALFIGAVMAPLSKWCKKAIPRWIKRDKKESKKVSDNDWSFKDKTLPWDDESTVSDEELWDGWNENAMLDIVLIRDEEEMVGTDDFLRGTFLEWNEADIIDSAQSDDARNCSDKERFFSRDDASRCIDDDVSQLDNDDDDVRRPNDGDDDDDVSRFGNDDSYYQEDIYDDLGIDDDGDTSDEWTDDCDSMDEAVDAFLDAFLEGRRAQ